jgi:hypothetical protein
MFVAGPNVTPKRRAGENVAALCLKEASSLLLRPLAQWASSSRSGATEALSEHVADAALTCINGARGRSCIVSVARKWRRIMRKIAILCTMRSKHSGAGPGGAAAF